MKIHRFYTPDLKLVNDLWLKDPALLHQWTRVLRFRPGQEVVLFDGVQHDKLYRIVEIFADETHLTQIAEYKRTTPAKNIYLLWSVLKKDKNDWVLQKGTELGVSHFVPLLADRSEKTGINHERAQKIIIEASEQCGRSDIPTIREPVHVVKALEQYADTAMLYICEQASEETQPVDHDCGVLIGPEGGWSDAEKQLFADQNVKQLNLHDFTLRAETACVVAVTKLLQ